MSAAPARVWQTSRGELGLGVPISVDTRKPEVIDAALPAGLR